MKKLHYFLICLCVTVGCIQKFQPVISSPPTGYLVVEGIINSSGGPATVHLSRANVLTDSTRIFEAGAMVQVEGNDNSTYPFSDQGNGVYGIGQLPLNTVAQYRLHIKTSAGKEYLSDYSPVKVTPPIDSLNWKQTGGGVQVYVNTHDPQNATIYYQWDYTETWEFHSRYFTDLYYDTLRDVNGNPLFDSGNRPELVVNSANNVNYDIYTCWQNAASTDVLIGSTAKLSSDVIFESPVSLIDQNSEKLSVRYSILVNQYALTLEAYNFLQIIKKNTEETGSIFSAQPSALQGNIHAVGNPSEIVVGYVGFASLQSKRIFIDASQLSNWIVESTPGCYENEYHNIPDEVLIPFYSNLLPTTPVDIDFATGFVITFNAAPAFCVDCRLRGTNQQPSFWQ